MRRTLVRFVVRHDRLVHFAKDLSFPDPKRNTEALTKAKSHAPAIDAKLLSEGHLA